MSEIIDKVTAALMASLKEQMGGGQIPGVPIDSWSARGVGVIDTGVLARAAIAALREPSAAMIDAGGNCPVVNYDGNDPREVWQAMIDAALTS